jgi:putative peptidoglycan lipid II flippase
MRGDINSMPRSPSVTSTTAQSTGGLAKTLARLAPATLLIQLVQFGSSVVLATQLGATVMTDAYFLALSVPFLAFAVLEAAVRLGAIPSLTEISRGDSSHTFSARCRELVTATLAAATLLSVCITAAMSIVLPAAAASHDGQLAALTRQYLIELAPYAVTGATFGALSAILAVKGKFAIPALMLGCEPLAKIILVLAFPQLGAQALVLGSLAGNLLAVFVLWKMVERGGVPLALVGFRASRFVRRVFRLTLPLAVGATVLQFNPLIDRTMAAALGAGNVTAFELGGRLFSAPAALLGSILAAPLAASWSTRLAQGGWAAVVSSFSRVVGAVVLVVPPLATAGFVVRDDLVGLVYRSHAYTALAVSRTADVFGLLLLGLVAALLIMPLATLFLIHGDTVFPMKIAFANALINTVLDLALRKPLGVGGIALSTTLTYTLLCAAYFVQAQRRWGSLKLRSMSRPLAVSGASCVLILVFGASVFGLNHSTSSRFHELVVTAAVFATAALIHGALMMVARVSDVIALPLRPGWNPMPTLRR